MVKAYKQKVFNGQMPVFDGRKNLYSRDPLPIGREKVGTNLCFFHILYESLHITGQNWSAENWYWGKSAQVEPILTCHIKISLHVLFLISSYCLIIVGSHPLSTWPSMCHWYGQSLCSALYTPTHTQVSDHCLLHDAEARTFRQLALCVLPCRFDNLELTTCWSHW